MRRIAGADGCRAGWLRVERLADGELEAAVLSTDQLVANALEFAVLTIDIPIGLPDAGPRAVDVHARRLLGPRGSSVLRCGGLPGRTGRRSGNMGPVPAPERVAELGAPHGDFRPAPGNRGELTALFRWRTGLFQRATACFRCFHARSRALFGCREEMPAPPVNDRAIGCAAG